MSARKSGRNFFQAHWEWLVAGAGIASAAAVLALTSGEEEATYGGGFPAPKGKPAKELSMSPYDAVSEVFSNPARLEAIGEGEGSFLASGLRVMCAPGDANVAGCGRPIPFPSEKCPYCGASQKEEEKPTEDHDRDGLPDEWEKKYGLNHLDDSDANLDGDSDGFTNIEEFEAGTDPTDAKSHPDYLPDLKLGQKLDEVPSPIMFEKVDYVTADGKAKLRFKDVRFKKAFPSGFTAYKGDEVKGVDSNMGRSREVTTGFTVIDYTEKEVKRRIKGSSGTKTELVRSVVVERKADGKRVTLVEGHANTPLELKATILFDRIAEKGTQEFTVITGDEFDVNGSKYKVESIEKLANGNFQVVVTSETSKEKRTIKALEQ